MTAVETHRDESLTAIGDVLNVVLDATDVPTALARLNGVLAARGGVVVASISVADRATRGRLGALEPDAVEGALIAAWRREPPDQREPLAWEGALLVPVSAGRRVVGVARIGAVDGRDPSSIERSTARSVGAACGAIVRTARLAHEVSLARTGLSDAVEQVDASAELRLTVDALLDELDARLGGMDVAMGDAEWRQRFDDLAGIVLRGRRAVHRMAQLPELLGAGRRRGLLASLRELGRRFECMTGTPVRVEVRGEARPLPGRHERALFRVACDALVSIDGPSRASIIILLVVFGPGEATLSVRDDGTGLAQRDPFGRPGLARLRRHADRAGAAVAVRNLRPHGVLVECVLPVDWERR